MERKTLELPITNMITSSLSLSRQILEIQFQLVHINFLLGHEFTLLELVI